MSLLFGEPRQIGYVVADIHAAMNHFADVLGIGPWFFSDVSSHVWGNYRGRSLSDDDLSKMHLSTAMAHSGDMQFELLSPRGDTPNFWREFIDGGKGGLHHWSSWEENYDERKADVLANGYILAYEGMSPRGRFAYFEHPQLLGSVIEIADYTPERRKVFRGIEQASRNWDGRDPIRTVWPG